jgi:hypothetical protein
MEIEFKKQMLQLMKSYTYSLKYKILIMHIMFVVRFAAMGRKQTNLNVQNPTSTSIRYGDLQWANKIKQGFAHSTSVFFAFILWECVSDFIEG